MTADKSPWSTRAVMPHTVSSPSSKKYMGRVSHHSERPHASRADSATSNTASTSAGLATS